MVLGSHTDIHFSHGCKIDQSNGLDRLVVKVELSHRHGHSIEVLEQAHLLHYRQGAGIETKGGTKALDDSGSFKDDIIDTGMFEHVGQGEAADSSADNGHFDVAWHCEEVK